ncbi:MAG: hypothetical protein II709_07050 [Ruminococcus sp.]|nr:hypothetical protein [uncultured Ruminococcus sp.]MBQ1349972.1 hypothetical protein [Ruminococcus sp.]MBQ4261621.1 hypothetical protein [Ruminococcus sp.]SCX27855.1 A2L zinc ribbon domain-containing protein [Ruminococcaceae bacterium P7]
MSQNTIHLQCKSCGGNLDIDRNQSLIFCPFCGSRELLIDSDAVAVEKIRQQTEFKKWEREDLQQQREENEKYKNSKAGNVALVFAIICGLMFVGSVTIIRSVPNFLRSLSLLLQTASFLLSFLIRKETVRLPEKLQLKAVRTPTLLMVIGFALFIVTFIFTAM